MTPTSALRATVLLAAMVSLGLVVVFARLFSALLGAEVAIWARGFSLLGVALGGMGAGLLAGRLARSRLLAAMGALLGAASFVTILLTIAVLRVAPPQEGALAAPSRLALVALLAALPFVLIGAASVAALAHARAEAPRVAAFQLAGAAAAIPLSVALLREVGAPRAALVLAVLLAVAGLCAALGSRPGPGRPRAGSPALAWGFVVGALAVLGGDLGAPWLRVTYTRGARADRAELVAWSEMGLVTIDVPSKGGVAAIHTDGKGAGGALAAAAEPPKLPDQMGYALAGPRRPVLVLGAGGGREVRAAVVAVEAEVYATEVDPVVIDAMVHGLLREHAGDVLVRPEVKLVATDARGYAARNPGGFRTIVASMTDSDTVGPAVTMVGADSGLTTMEGTLALLGALAPDGALVVSRPEADAERVVALLAAALRAQGNDAPRAHLFACSHQKSTAVLAGRQPLGAQDVTALRQLCKRGRWREDLAPDRASRPELAVLADDPAAAQADVDRDLTPPTDDRPFFSYGVRRDGLLHALGDGATLRAEPLLGSAALMSALGVLVLGALVIVARLAGGATSRGPRSARAPRGIAFFAAAGCAFALVEAALVQRLALFVAHPAHALLVVMLVLLGSGAVGAVLVRRTDAASIDGVVARHGQLLAVLLSVLALGLGPVLDAAAQAPAALRAVLAAAVVAPVGLLAGGFMPLAVRALASWSPGRAALATGVGGAGALFGTGVGALLALHAGLSFMLLLGAALSLVASVLDPRPAHGRA